MNKIASTTISLSWIFMIVIGGFFVLMSYNIIQKYQDNEEAKFELEVQQSLRAILNNVGRTSGVEENTLEPIGNIFRDSEVTMLCEAGVPLLSINGKIDANNNFLRNYPSFMNYIVEEDVSFTYLAVENFKLPFKINNMLGIVSRKNIIVLDEGSLISEQLVDKFRRGSYENLNYHGKDFDLFDGDALWLQFATQNPSSIVFVSDDTRPNIDLTGIPIPAYNIKIDQVTVHTGEIQYIDSENAITRFNYVDFFDPSYQEPSLGLITMAVFSTPEIFECSYNMLIEQIGEVFDFYIDKTQYLSQVGLSEQICSSNLVKNDPVTGFEGSQQSAVYDEMATALTSSKTLIENEKFNNPQNVYSSISAVEEVSRRLEEFNCKYVY